jgi:nitroimidazol reductase NimA-like FMN-containing flavoprotein (pyridoxamine 5'-phosphate oxidase superfamily)
MKLSMTRAEREAFLAGVHVGVLSVAEPGRGPLSAPISYGYEPGGEIWLVTGRDSRKGKLLAPGVRVALVAQSEEAPYRYVSVEGPVTSVVPSPGEAEERRLAHRYLGPKLGDAYVASTAERRAAEPNVLVRIRPERWLSVDYRKAYP